MDEIRQNCREPEPFRVLGDIGSARDFVANRVDTERSRLTNKTINRVFEWSSSSFVRPIGLVIVYFFLLLALSQIKLDRMCSSCVRDRLVFEVLYAECTVYLRRMHFIAST